MITICNIVHLRSKDVPSIENLTTPLLQNIACLADKYGFVDAVGLVVKPWLVEFVENILIL